MYEINKEQMKTLDKDQTKNASSATVTDAFDVIVFDAENDRCTAVL